MSRPAPPIAGFKAGVDTTKLIAGWGKGEFVMRVYRGVDLLAEGHFTLRGSPSGRLAVAAGDLAPGIGVEARADRQVAGVRDPCRRSRRWTPG